jgi:hypothetical protein
MYSNPIPITYVGNDGCCNCCGCIFGAIALLGFAIGVIYILGVIS